MATKIYLQENLKYLRKQHRLTYQEMADIADCTLASMKSYELRGSTPPLEALIKLTDKFDLTLDKLIRTKLGTLNARNAKDNESITLDDLNEIRKSIDLLKKKIKAK